MSTPSNPIDEVATPKAPRFAPASPPTTGRAARRSKRIESSSPAGPSDEDFRHSKRASPFDAWQRTKPTMSTGSKKRDGSDGLAEGPSSKRRRGLVSS